MSVYGLTSPSMLKKVMVLQLLRLIVWDTSSYYFFNQTLRMLWNLNIYSNS